MEMDTAELVSDFMIAPTPTCSGALNNTGGLMVDAVPHCRQPTLGRNPHPQILGGSFPSDRP
jgi:hypothetical protein